MAAYVAGFLQGHMYSECFLNRSIERPTHAQHLRCQRHTAVAMIALHKHCVLQECRTQYDAAYGPRFLDNKLLMASSRNDLHQHVTARLHAYRTYVVHACRHPADVCIPSRLLMTQQPCPGRHMEFSKQPQLVLVTRSYRAEHIKVTQWHRRSRNLHAKLMPVASTPHIKV